MKGKNNQIMGLLPPRYEGIVSMGISSSRLLVISFRSFPPMKIFSTVFLGSIGLMNFQQ